MPRPVKRLSPSSVTKQRISAALTGRAKSPEHRERIAAALRGRAKAPEHRAAIARSAARRGDVLGECRREARRRRTAQDQARIKQWHEDMLKAIRLGPAYRALFEDIRGSCGFSNLRKYHDPNVSRGYEVLAWKGHRSNATAYVPSLRVDDAAGGPGAGAPVRLPGVHPSSVADRAR